MPARKKHNKLTNFAKLNTPKKKMLLFVLVFAIIGGSYMAYKSFAYAGLATANAPSMTVANGATHTQICSSKGCVNVVSIPQSASASATGLLTTNFSAPKTLYVCATAMGDGILDLGGVGNGGVWGVTSQFQDYCYGATVGSGFRNSYLHANNIRGGGHVNISQFSFRW